MRDTNSTEHPATTLGWERGQIFGAEAWRLDATDLIAQWNGSEWDIYLEHETYGPEWQAPVPRWQDVLDYVNSGADLESSSDA